MLNLSDAHRDTYALPPIDVAISDTGLTLNAGLQYVFSLQGTALAVRGSDDSTLSATLKLATPDAQHNYVGSIIFEAGLTASVSTQSSLSLCPRPPSAATGSRKLSPIRSALSMVPISRPSTFSTPTRSPSQPASSSPTRSRPTTRIRRWATCILAVSLAAPRR